MEDIDVRTKKKRKICDGDVDLTTLSTLLCLRSDHTGVVDKPFGSLVSPASSVNSKEINDHVSSDEPAGSSTSCCSNNSKSIDLDENVMEYKSPERLFSKRKEECSEMECTNNMAKQDENCGSQEKEKEESDRKEIEEFFARYNQHMFKIFREKYNFDFEKEEPLEGRYEWFQI